MSDLNEISVAIGRLQATQEQHGTAHTQIMSKLDTIAASQATITAEMPALKEDVLEALNHGRDWKKSKNRVIGGGLTLSALFGGMAAHVKDFFGG